MTRRAAIPRPTYSESWEQWALRLAEALEQADSGLSELDPQAVLLERLTDPTIQKPEPAGILMYDAAYPAVVVSTGTEWSPVTGDGSVAWGAISGKPDEFAPEYHTHTWAQVTNKPAKFPPANHTHDFSEITGTVPSHTQDLNTITPRPAKKSVVDDLIIQVNDLLTRINVPVTVSDTAPSFPNPGDLWFRSTSNNPSLYLYYDDGSDEYWIDVSGLTVSSKVTTISTTPPSSPVNGQFWLRDGSDNPGLYVYYDNGSSAQWVMWHGNQLS